LRMVTAIHRTQKWIHACSAAELAATVSPFFPALASGVLTGAIARYQAQGVWGRDPFLPEDGFDRLQNSLVSSGFTRRPVPYTACVDNRFARQVLAV
jgi:NitT/TauT family transport system substrate-binding protein